jgi:hypothetical protein
MTKKYRTYDELVKHKNELDLLLRAQKELIIADLKMLQAEMKGPRAAFSFASRLMTKKKTNPILNIGVNRVVDVLFNKVLLARYGWITRTLVTFFAKNYSSHLVSNVEKNKIPVLNKIFSWLKPRHTNGKAAPEAFGDLG